MAICLNCGKETEGYLCDECSQLVNLEELIAKISVYTPMVIDNPNTNPVWEKAALEMEYPANFRNIAFDLADGLPTPRKEYRKILSLIGKNIRVPRESKPWFYEVYEQIIQMDELADEEKLKLKGLMLEALYQDYRYSEADKLISELLEEENLPWETIYFVAEFLSQTRRYDDAEEMIGEGSELNTGNEDVVKKFIDLSEKNKKRRVAADTGKKGKEYMPNPKENKESAVAKYTEFMSTLGIDITKPSPCSLSDCKLSSCPKPIPKNEYPDPVEKKETDFDSFVAFDFETTGVNSNRDAIIEVGAIRVVNGRLVESEEFLFQEFVRPFKRTLQAKITELTGITKENLENARQMWEVIPEFMEFVGDDILVGYNSIGFDAKFLCRAGRYCNKVYDNKHFDVLKLARESVKKINYTGQDLKLTSVGEFLGIDNPNAHRALADAITTAKIYLKLREM